MFSPDIENRSPSISLAAKWKIKKKNKAMTMNVKHIINITLYGKKDKNV